MRPKSTAPSSRRTSKTRGLGRDSREGSADIDPSRSPSQYDPDREGSPSKSGKSRQADELTGRTSHDQTRAIKETLAEVNKRWTNLKKTIRQKKLEHALIKL